MKSRIRIILVASFLIGGTMFFGNWSIRQFNNVFDNLGVSTANTYSTYTTYTSFKRNTEDEGNPVITSTTTTATTTPVTATSTNSGQATSTNPELSFTFPQKGDETYIGCNYPISWQSSTTIHSLQTALVDAGTKESVGPIASGLPKEIAIETDSQNLKWKVGVVWPGSYYIKVSKINGLEAEFRSRVFKINKMSENISTKEKENVCKGSGGSF